MNNKSRKAKARYLQNLVRDRIMKLFPSLTKDDIRCAMMSENGADYLSVDSVDGFVKLKFSIFCSFGFTLSSANLRL